jgi:endonuclease/exonuclease/phosphatase family metal-dependent hydrolase
MFVLLLLYPLHYELPLPVDNRWLPGIAVAVACLPLLHRPAEMQPRYERAVPSRLHIPAVIIVGVGALVLAATVHAGIVGGSLLPGPDESLAAGEPQPGQVSVATYNTGQGQDAATGRLAFRTVAEAIVELDADVVALQEVARGWPLTAMADFDAWLRANTDLTIHYTPAADQQFGNALVARVPLAAVHDLDLGQQGGAQRRSAVRAALADGTTVYAMHLQARNSEAGEQSRLEQMQQIIDDWSGRPATVLAGDMNPRNEYADATETPPKLISNLEVFLGAGFVTTQPTELCTQPTSNDNCSDYVFTTPDLELAAANEVLAVEVSDHRPVLARIDAD